VRRDGSVQRVKITELLMTEGLERKPMDPDTAPVPATSSPSPASTRS
jgi:predicted membrane GTPase involved in stress response